MTQGEYVDADFRRITRDETWVAFSWNGWSPRLSVSAQADPLSTISDARKLDFDRLAARWERDTRNAGSPSRRFSHPAYLRIIAMADDATTLILNRIRTKPGMWFEALEALTGANPVEDNDVGDVEAMTDAWLRWGRRNGYC